MSIYFQPLKCFSVVSLSLDNYENISKNFVKLWTNWTKEGTQNEQLSFTGMLVTSGWQGILSKDQPSHFLHKIMLESCNVNCHAWTRSCLMIPWIAFLLLEKLSKAYLLLMGILPPCKSWTTFEFSFVFLLFSYVCFIFLPNCSQ